MARYIDIANLKGPKGETGPRGLPGVNAVENDEAVAAYIAAPDSATRAQLSATIEERTGVTVSVADYPTLRDAIEALPAEGGTVFVPLGRFPAGSWTYDTDYMDKPNVRLQGAKLPRPSANADRLEAGSIIYGRFNAFADGFEVDAVGFDMGKYVIDSFYGGVDTHAVNHPLGGTWDAFAFAQPNLGAPLPARRGVRIGSIIGLLRDSQTVGHAVLIEGIDGCTVEHVKGIGGVHAAVVKSSHVTGGTIEGYASSNNNVIFKSDEYAPAGHISFESVISGRQIPGVTPWYEPLSGVGLRINPVGAPFSGPIYVGSFSAFGCSDGLSLVGAAGQIAADIQIGRILVDGYGGSTVNAITAYASKFLRVSIGDLTVNTVSQGIVWESGTADTTGEAQLHVRKAQFTNIAIRAINVGENGRVRIDSLGITTALSAYYLEDTARLFIGTPQLVSVVSKWERSAPVFSGGWTNFGGGEEEMDIELAQYGATLRGLVKPVTGAGTEILSLPAFLRSPNTRRFPVYYNNGSNQTGLVEIAEDGRVRSGAEMTTAGFVSLDGAAWSIA